VRAPGLGGDGQRRVADGAGVAGVEDCDEMRRREALGGADGRDRVTHAAVLVRRVALLAGVRRRHGDDDHERDEQDEADEAAESRVTEEGAHGSRHGGILRDAPRGATAASALAER
jgi:hypothetical protein